MSNGKCKKCGKPVICVDVQYPSMFVPDMFHVDDTEWADPPVEHGDPGLLMSKPGAIPSTECQG